MSTTKYIKIYAYEVCKTPLNNNSDRNMIDDNLNEIQLLDIEERDANGLRIDELTKETIGQHDIWLMHFSKTRELAPGKRKTNDVIEGIDLDPDEDFAEDVVALYCKSKGYFLMQSSIFFTKNMVQLYFEDFYNDNFSVNNTVFEIIDVLTFDGLQKLLSSQNAQRFTFKVTHDKSFGDGNHVQDAGLPFKQVSELMDKHFGGSEVTITVGNGRAGLLSSASTKIADAFSAMKGKGYLDNAEVAIKPSKDERITHVNLIEGRKNFEKQVQLDSYGRPKLAERYKLLRELYQEL